MTNCAHGHPKVKRRGCANDATVEERTRSSTGAAGNEELTATAAWLIQICVPFPAAPSMKSLSITSRKISGFDSLNVCELAQAVENAGGALTAPERLNEVQDVRELLTVVNRQAAQSARRESTRLRLDAEKG